MRHLNRLLLVASAAFFIASSAFAQNSGTVTNHALAVGKGAGTSGYTSLLLGAGQVPFGQSSADPISQTLGTMGLQNSNSVAITGGAITGLPSPSASTDAATKAYVDSTASGLNILASSALATAAVLPNTPTYANGTAGVGATLTAGSNTTLTVDGTAAPLNTVVLVKNQASAFQNGIYTVTQAGSGSVPWILTRATYFDQAAEMKGGSYTFVTAGATNINSSYVLQTTITTVGTDALNWALFVSGAVSVQSIGGANGIITIGPGLKIPGNVLDVSAGVLTNVLNTQTLPYTIATTDTGKTVNIAGGPGTLTLPSVSGFASNAVVSVCNTAANSNTTHAVTLSGFPNPSLPHLWMGQCETLKIVNGAWAVGSFPGKFYPAFVMSCFVDTGGSNANDGLVSNASTNAVKDPNQCMQMWNSEIELNGQQPSITLTSGQTNPQSGGAGPLTLLGGVPKVVFVQGNGGNATLQNTGGNVVAQVQDFGGYFIFVNVTLDCTNAASHPCFNLFMHQQGGTDLNASVTLKGAASNDTGVICDSVCKINGNNLVTLAGTFANAFEGDQLSAFKFSNGITTAASTTIVNNMFLMTGGSRMSYSGPMTAGASTSVNTMFTGRDGSSFCVAMGTVTGTFLGLTQWSILGNSVFSNLTTVPVPGGAGSNSAAGFAPGIIAAATSGGC